MVVLSGWRAALAILAGAVLLVLLLAAIFWAGVLFVGLLGVLWLNWFLLPRLARRSRLPELLLAALLLALVVGGGALVFGTNGAIGGGAIWVLGVLLPRAVAARVRRRFARMQQVDLRARSAPVVDAGFRALDNHPDGVD